MKDLLGLGAFFLAPFWNIQGGKVPEIPIFSGLSIPFFTNDIEGNWRKGPCISNSSFLTVLSDFKWKREGSFAAHLRFRAAVQNKGAEDNKSSWGDNRASIILS